MKLTRHNGRSGKDGTYSVKHNDRLFPVEHADHINSELTSKNIYWDCYHGIRDANETESFEDVEKKFYKENYSDYIKGQNVRNEKNRHQERNRTTEQLRHNTKTCPEETIFQIGTKDDHISPDILLAIVTDFTESFEEKFGANIHILDWSLHLDEQSPHIHERHVYDATNQHDELMPQQEGALKALGFDLPDPAKKQGRYNNRKVLFDKYCREMLFDICKHHGLCLEEEPTGGRKHLEKQAFIIQEQQKQIKEQQKIIDGNNEVIAGQNNKIDSKEDQLDELTMKVNDIETLISAVSETAYAQAFSVVTDVACREAQKQDIKLIEGTKDWLKSPNQKESQSKLEYASSILDHTISKLQKYSERVLQSVRKILASPKYRKECIEDIKAKTRESIFKRINKNKGKIAEQDRKKPSIFTERQDQQAL